MEKFGTVGQSYKREACIVVQCLERMRWRAERAAVQEAGGEEKGWKEAAEDRSLI